MGYTTIKAADFATHTDSLSHVWDGGKIRHLTAVAAGQKMLVEVDKQTGHTVEGVLEGYRPGFTGNGRILLRSCGQLTAYWAPSVGNIILHDPIEKRSAKWAALDSYREESSAAIRQAKQEHPELSWGKWEGTPRAEDNTVSVTYTEQRPDCGGRWHGIVVVETVAA